MKTETVTKVDPKIDTVVESDSGMISVMKRNGNYLRRVNKVRYYCSNCKVEHIQKIDTLVIVQGFCAYCRNYLQWVPVEYAKE